VKISSNFAPVTQLSATPLDWPDVTAPRSLLQRLDLSRSAPLAGGSNRRIFQHPDHGDLLVKIIDSDKRHKYMNKRRMFRWYKHLHREGAYRTHLAEIAEYAAAYRKAAGRWKLPLARVVGLAETTAGLGLVVEKITAGGGLAPTLYQFVRAEGFDPQLRLRLDLFFDALADAHVLFNDVSGSNIAVGENAEGEAGLYLIDGYGSKQLVPLYAMSKWLNRRRLERKYERLLAKLRRVARPA
jgi:hypothetical protein